MQDHYRNTESEKNNQDQINRIPSSELPYIFSGKRLLRNEIQLTESEFKYALSSGLFQSMASFNRIYLLKTCQRCGNNKFFLIGKIACSTCKIVHNYCRKCIQMGRVMDCTPLYKWNGPEPIWKNSKSPLHWNGNLTDLQQAASNRVVECVKKSTGELLIWAVCGAGKTEILFEGIEQALMLGYRVCLATPRTDVVKELLPRFKAAFPDVKIEGLYGGSEDKIGKSQFIIATTHQLLRFYKAFDCLIIDEVDAFPFHKEPMLQYAAKQVVKDVHSLIYLTATPRQNLVLRTKTNEIPHYFIPSRFHGYPLPVPQSILSFDLQKKLSQFRPPSHFIRWLNDRESKMRQLLIFVPTISLAEQLYENMKFILKQSSVIQEESELTFVHAEDSKRNERVQDFRQKKLKALITTTILERGVTFPSVDVIVLDAGHSIFDEAALVQIAGRAGRSTKDPKGDVLFYHNGKTNAIVRAIKSIKSMNQRGGF